jgi:hypothetical protein
MAGGNTTKAGGTPWGPRGGGTSYDAAKAKQIDVTEATLPKKEHANEKIK